MPARISAGVGDYPCFHTFISMIPIDCKLLIFPYTCIRYNYFISQCTGVRDNEQRFTASN